MNYKVANQGRANHFSDILANDKFLTLLIYSLEFKSAFLTRCHISSFHNIAVTFHFKDCIHTELVIV